MKKEKVILKVSLLRRALRIAAIDLFHSEISTKELYTSTIGVDKEYPTVEIWLTEHEKDWIQQAELKQ